MRYQTAPRPGRARVYAKIPSGRAANICSMRPNSEGMRRCGGCGESKPVAEFAWRRKERGQRDNMCRPCRSAYGRAQYEANRQRYIDQARLQKQRLRLERTIYLFQYFVEHPCVDCGETDPVVLEFDHLRDKLFNIGRALSFRNWQSILDEIAKCEVVCRNCHQRREARRSGSVRAVLAKLGDS
jgi:hypothetical protein